MRLRERLCGRTGERERERERGGCWKMCVKEEAHHARENKFFFKKYTLFLK